MTNTTTPAAEKAHYADIMAKVLDTFQNQGVQSMSHEQRRDYLSSVMQVAYQMMRGVEGDEFVRGFFESALADMEANPGSMIEFRQPN